MIAVDILRQTDRHFKRQLPQLRSSLTLSRCRSAEELLFHEPSKLPDRQLYYNKLRRRVRSTLGLAQLSNVTLCLLKARPFHSHLQHVRGCRQVGSNDDDDIVLGDGEVVDERGLVQYHPVLHGSVFA
jgi:hypothetical protein